MARYIKANPLVARYLQLENDRNMVSDGNYLFWQNDMLKFGPLTQLNDILVKIGGIALMPHEARSEQDGTICRPLPMATDARFQQPIKANVNDAIVGDNTNTEQGADGKGENTESTDNSGNSNEGQANEGQANEENAEGDQQPEASESEQTESETKK
jgi:hypothetical protein|nr:MAG TPA: hypothetical protein [Caudoviricetes sp.]